MRTLQDAQCFQVCRVLFAISTLLDNTQLSPVVAKTHVTSLLHSTHQPASGCALSASEFPEIYRDMRCWRICLLGPGCLIEHAIFNVTVPQWRQRHSSVSETISSQFNFLPPTTTSHLVAEWAGLVTVGQSSHVNLWLHLALWETHQSKYHHL